MEERVEINKAFLEQRLAKIDEDSFDVITKMKEILNKVFGEANNQIQKVEYKWEKEIGFDRRTQDFEELLGARIRSYPIYQVVIYTPEVVITNRNGNSHTIKDIFVRYPLKANGSLTGNFDGMRTSYTSNEYRSHYTHSHLSGTCINWSRFCTGSGPINQVIALLAAGFNPINFELLCYHTKSYLAYESIEGTPYMYLEQIGSGVQTQAYPIEHYSTQLDSIYETLVNKRFFTPSYIRENCIIEVRDTYIDVKPKDSFEETVYLKMKDIMTTTPSRELRQISFATGMSLDSISAIKRADGSYVRSGTSDTLNVPNTTLITFKGNPIKLKILDDEAKQKKTIYANPDITKYLIKRISTSLTKAAFKYRHTVTAD